MTKELIQLASMVRDMDGDSVFTMWLHMRRLSEQYRERGNKTESAFCAKLAALLDAKYKEVAAA